MTSELSPGFLPPAPREVSLLRVEPQVYCYCSFRNVTIATWVGQATVPSLYAMGAISREMVRQHSEGHSSVVFILDKIPPPSQEASELIERAFHARNGLACVAAVVEGTGFWASGMRSMMGNAHRSAANATTTLMRLSKSIEEVVAWLPVEHVRRTGVTLHSEPLAAALRWVREHGAAQALNASAS